MKDETAPVVGAVKNEWLEKYPWLPFVAVVAVIGIPLGFAMLGGKKGR